MYISYFPARVAAFNPAFNIVQFSLQVSALRCVTLKTCKGFGQVNNFEKFLEKP